MSVKAFISASSPGRRNAVEEGRRPRVEREYLLGSHALGDRAEDDEAGDQRDEANDDRCRRDTDRRMRHGSGRRWAGLIDQAEWTGLSQRTGLAAQPSLGPSAAVGMSHPTSCAARASGESAAGWWAQPPGRVNHA